jgi:hypothetical protein
MRLLTLFCVTVLAAGCARMVNDDKAPKTNTSGQDQSDGNPETQVKGKPVSAWSQKLRDKDISTRIEAAQVLKSLGPQAKAAVGDLKLAIKERAWELLLENLGKHTDSQFTVVSGKLGGSAPQTPTKDEIIADLRRELEQKKKEIAKVHKQMDDMGNDACLQSLILALDAIDRQEMEAMIPHGPPSRTKTFRSAPPK